jgi:hypothetical protein
MMGYAVDPPNLPLLKLTSALSLVELVELGELAGPAELLVSEAAAPRLLWSVGLPVQTNTLGAKKKQIATPNWNHSSLHWMPSTILHKHVVTS